MRFASGCLMGIVLGIIASILVYLGFSWLNPQDNAGLLPATTVSNSDLVVTIGQQYLNDEMRKRLASNGMNVTNLSIALRSQDTALASMTIPVTFLGRSIRVTLNATLHFGVSNGLVTINVEKVQVSGFAVPQEIVNQQMGAFKREAEAQINSELNKGLIGSGLHVTAIDSVEGAMTIKLSR